MAGRKNYKSLVNDVAEGLIVVNPIFLKNFQPEEFIQFYKALERKLTELRIEPFPYGQADLIRRRNMRMQRVYNAMMIINNQAREKKIRIV